MCTLPQWLYAELCGQTISQTRQNDNDGNEYSWVSDRPQTRQFCKIDHHHMKLSRSSSKFHIFHISVCQQCQQDISRELSFLLLIWTRHLNWNLFALISLCTFISSCCGCCFTSKHCNLVRKYRIISSTKTRMALSSFLDDACRLCASPHCSCFRIKSRRTKVPDCVISYRFCVCRGWSHFTLSLKRHFCACNFLSSAPFQWHIAYKIQRLYIVKQASRPSPSSVSQCFTS